MRNSHNITLTNNDSLTEVEDTTWSLPRCGWFFIVAVRVGNSDVDLWL